MDLAGLGDEPGERALHVPLLAGGLLPHHLVVGDGLAVGRGADVAVAVRELREVVGNTARVLLVVTCGENVTAYSECFQRCSYLCEGWRFAWAWSAERAWPR